MGQEPNAWTNDSSGIVVIIEAAKPFCILPWYHQLVNTDGSKMPCCGWQGQRTSPDNEFFHGQFMDELRVSFANGTPHEGCQNCLYQEKIDGTSLRTAAWKIADSKRIDWQQGPLLRSQEVHFSNLCNQRCRSCGQDRSTKWIADAEAFGENPIGLLHSGWRLDIEAAANMQHLVFLGGEPMLHQSEIAEAIRMIEQYGNISGLSVIFNTNLSVAFTAELLELIERCSHTHVTASIDAVGTLNEYIRSDSIWSDTVRNLQQLSQLKSTHDNFSWNIGSVYSVLNANRLDEFTSWVEAEFPGTDIGIIFLSGPSWLDARNLPETAKSRLLVHYQNSIDNHRNYTKEFVGVINHLKQTYQISPAEWFDQFKRHNGFLDDRRGTSFAEVNAEMQELLGIEP